MDHTQASVEMEVVCLLPGVVVITFLVALATAENQDLYGQYSIVRMLHLNLFMT